MKFLKKLFGLEEPVLIQELEEPIEGNEPEVTDDILGIISYTLLKTGDINVDFKWQDNSEEICKLYAALLYALHSGKLMMGTGEKMVEVCSISPEIEDFMVRTLNEWTNLVQKASNIPLIKASEVFNLGRTEDNR